MLRGSVYVTLLIVLLFALSPPVPAAAIDYDITVEESVDTPPRTVAFNGMNYTISAIARVAPNDTLTVHVTTPHDDGYWLYLYNAEKQIVDSKRGTGDTTFDFALTNYRVGSYMLTIQYDGINQAIHPLVVRGYDVTVDAPANATSGSTFDVTVTVERHTDRRQLRRVEFVVANDTEELRVTLDKTSVGTYSGTISLDGLSPNTYTMYALVRGEKRAFGRAELLGLSNSLTLHLSERSHSLTHTSQQTSSTTTHSLDTETTTRSPSPSALITPISITDSPSSSPGQPGFGILTVLSAVILIFLLTRRHAS